MEFLKSKSFKTIIFTSIVVFLSGCDLNRNFSNQLEAKQMVINTILFSGSNPSLGPKYNVKSTRSLNMQKYQKELTALLDETTVNDSVTLREYLQHRLSNNTKEVTKIHDAYEPGELRQGERIINLTFRIEGQPDVTLKDLRYFKLSGKGYTAFKDLMQKNGSTQSYDPNQAYDPQKAK